RRPGRARGRRQRSDEPARLPRRARALVEDGRGREAARGGARSGARVAGASRAADTMMQSPRSRVAAIAVLALLTAVPFAFAAGHSVVAQGASPKPVVLKRATVVVPDVTGQPYVFAKGALEDAGFAWHVANGKGFAANTVASQSPAPGTRLVDTGAP